MQVGVKFYLPKFIFSITLYVIENQLLKIKFNSFYVIFLGSFI